MPTWVELRRTLGGLERWLLPPACLLCREPLPASDGDQLACGICRSRWTPLAPPWCERCGQPRDGELECRTCTGWPDGFGPVRSAAWMTEPSRRAVHLLKYEGWRRLGESMALAMRRLEPLEGADALVPVPLGAARHRRRGYNQSAELARPLGALVCRRVDERALVRARETATQTRLTPEARRANLAGAFRAGPGVRGRRLVLVDDVFTTGATLVEAAQALLAAGAQGVGAVTFARARRPLDALTTTDTLEDWT